MARGQAARPATPLACAQAGPGSLLAGLSGSHGGSSIFIVAAPLADTDNRVVMRLGQGTLGVPTCGDPAAFRVRQRRAQAP